MVFLKEFFKKVDFEKNQQTTKMHENYQLGKGGFCTYAIVINLMNWLISYITKGKGKAHKYVVLQVSYLLNPIEFIF